MSDPVEGTDSNGSGPPDSGPAASDTGRAGAKRTPKVVWDDSNMRMSYANVVNATRFVLFKGLKKRPNSGNVDVCGRLRTIADVTTARESQNGEIFLIIQVVVGESP